MFGRKTSGSVVCPSCGSLVGVRDDKCYVCGRANPSLWGFAPVLKSLGNDFGLIPFIMTVCVVVFALMVLLSRSDLRLNGGDLLAPGQVAYIVFGASGSIQVFRNGLWWTVLTASWMHGGLIHIVFNMMALRNVGPATVELIGPGRTLAIYVISGACR